MSVGIVALEQRPHRPLLRLGGYVALAKSAWMGAAQAADALEQLRLHAPHWRWRDGRTGSRWG